MTSCIRRFALVLALALAGSASVSVLAGDLGTRFDSHDVVGDNQPAKPAAAVAGPELVDQIVAVVNDEAITQVELDQRTAALTEQLAKQNANGQLPDRAVLRRQVLERMITDRVLVQYGKENGMRVDDATVDRAIARIAEDNKASLDQFRHNIEGDGMSWSRFREDIRNEILFARLRDREVESHVSVSDAEVDAELREEAQRGAGEDELLISHVLVSVPEGATPDVVAKREARAAEALQHLQAGDAFPQVAASYSDASDALQGGSLGWRPVSRIPTVFANLIGEMKKGEISKVIRSGSGFHVFEVMDRRGGKSVEVVHQYHLREILVRADPNVGESEARLKLRALRARIEGGEDFSQLARLNSEDESRTKGGDIGWVGAGETFPAFEKAMIALKPGQVSDIVSTPMGLHIIQLVDQRDNDLTEERRRTAARQGVRARKVDEGFDEWVREQRDAAYVEYRGPERQL